MVILWRLRIAWNKILSFSNPRKTFSAKNISAIVLFVCNLISKIVLLKMLLIMMRMMQIWQGAWSSCTDICFLVLRKYNWATRCRPNCRKRHCRRRLFWSIRTFCRYVVFPNKDSTPKQFAQEMLGSRNFRRCQPGL